jgi:hypothetical protein
MRPPVRGAWGFPNKDKVQGGAGDDTVDGGTLGCCQAGNDEVYGGPGNDIVFGSDTGTTNRLDGGPGNDVIQGFGPNDTAYGRSGQDQVFGFVGEDFLSGGQGNDLVGKADDTGNDVMWRPGRGRPRRWAGARHARRRGSDRRLHQRRSSPEVPVRALLDDELGGGPPRAPSPTY